MNKPHATGIAFLLDLLYVGNNGWDAPPRGERLALAVNIVALHDF